MTEWEYKIIRIKLESDLLAEISKLNAYGKDGWELCAVTTVKDGSTTGILKKEK